MKTSALRCFALALALCLLPVSAWAQEPAVPQPLSAPEMQPQPPEPQPSPGMQPPQPPQEMRPEPQPPERPGEPGLPDRLEDLIEMALANSPETRMARLQLEKAQIELMQAQSGVVQHVTDLFRQRMEAARALDKAHEQLEYFNRKKREGGGNFAPDFLDGVHRNLGEAQEQLERTESQLRMLVGAMPFVVPPVGGIGPGTHPQEPGGPPRGEPVKRPGLPPDSELAKQLAAPVSIEFDSCPLRDVLEFLHDSYSVNLVTGDIGDMPVTNNVESVPLRSALEAMSERANGDFCFVVRDYGVLAAPRDQAEMMPGPAIPDYVPYYGPPMD